MTKKYGSDGHKFVSFKEVRGPEEDEEIRAPTVYFDSDDNKLAYVEPGQPLPKFFLFEGDAAGGEEDLAETLALGNDANELQIKNLADPTDDQDAATKAYVDANVGAGGGDIDISIPANLLNNAIANHWSVHQYGANISNPAESEVYMDLVNMSILSWNSQRSNDVKGFVDSVSGFNKKTWWNLFGGSYLEVGKNFLAPPASDGDTIGLWLFEDNLNDSSSNSLALVDDQFQIGVSLDYVPSAFGTQGQAMRFPTDNFDDPGKHSRLIIPSTNPNHGLIDNLGNSTVEFMLRRTDPGMDFMWGQRAILSNVSNASAGDANPDNIELDADNWTVEAWVNANSTNNNIIWSKGPRGNSPWIELNIPGAGGIQAWGQFSDGAGIVLEGGDVAFQGWKHVALTYEKEAAGGVSNPDNIALDADAWTVAMWVRAPFMGNETLWSKGPDGSNGSAKLWVPGAGTGGAEFKLKFSDGQELTVSGSIDVLDNQWHHVAVTYEKTGGEHVAKLYVDGLLDVSGEESLAAGVETLDNAYHHSIGGGYAASGAMVNPFHDFMDDFVFVNGTAMTTFDQHNQATLSNFPGATIIYQMDNDNLQDYSGNGNDGAAYDQGGNPYTPEFSNAGMDARWEYPSDYGADFRSMQWYGSYGGFATSGGGHKFVLYVDNAEVAQQTFTDAGNDLASPAHHSVAAGYDNGGNLDGGSIFNGRIDDFVFTNGVTKTTFDLANEATSVTHSGATAIFNFNGDLTDASGNSNNGTERSGGAFYGAPKYGTASLETDDMMQFMYVSFGGFFVQGGANAFGRAIEFMEDGQLQVYFAARGEPCGSGQSLLADDTDWHHYAVLIDYDGSSEFEMNVGGPGVHFFKDGSYLSSCPFSGNYSPSEIQSNQDILVGATRYEWNGEEANWLTMDLDALKVHNGFVSDFGSIASSASFETIDLGAPVGAGINKAMVAIQDETSNVVRTIDGSTDGTNWDVLDLAAYTELETPLQKLRVTYDDDGGMAVRIKGVGLFNYKK